MLEGSNQNSRGFCKNDIRRLQSKSIPFPPDPNSSQSTINTVVREILEAGGSALALACDVRDFENITTLVDETVRQLGSIDVLVYNSGAIW